MKAQEIEIEGHLIDSLILAKVLDRIVELGGDFDILEFRVGKTNVDKSYSKLNIKAKDDETLRMILEDIKKEGAVVTDMEEAVLEKCPADGVVPDNFYSTTNHPTQVKIGSEWIEVKNSKMDCAIVIDGKNKAAETRKMGQVKKGEAVVVSSKGVRVTPPEKPRKRSAVFSFMSSNVSSEKPSDTILSYVAQEMRFLKKSGGKIVVVGGPAIVHTGGSKALAAIIRKGYVNALLSGNALAAHDIEYSLFGTSLGMDIESGKVIEGGNRNHLLAINKIRSIGSIKKAVETGVLKSGVMYECVKNGVPFQLAGSIRDDGPLPDVITDTIEAQKKMAEAVKDADLVLMLATTLHSIAVGNLLASRVRTICIDINPAVVTKLMDRGSSQALGVVSEVGLFLKALNEKL